MINGCIVARELRSLYSWTFFARNALDHVYPGTEWYIRAGLIEPTGIGSSVRLTGKAVRMLHRMGDTEFRNRLGHGQ